MQQVLLDHLRKITEEEQRILDGVAEVDKDLYTSGQDFTVDSAKMLSEGKLIAVRTHTVCTFSVAQAQFYRGALCLSGTTCQYYWREGSCDTEGRTALSESVYAA